MPRKKFIQLYISAKAREMRRPENAEEFKRITNGCGPSGWKIDIVPDTLYGLHIRYECNDHDLDWHFAETWEEALIGNIIFKKAAHYKIKQHSFWLRGLRYIRFNWYMLAVNGKKGKAHFETIKKRG